MDHIQRRQRRSLPAQNQRWSMALRTRHYGWNLFVHSAYKKLVRNTENMDQNSGKNLPHLQICLGKSHKEALCSNRLCPRKKHIEAATLAGLAATAAEKEPDSPKAPDLPCLSQLPAHLNKNENISKHFCQSQTKPQQNHSKTTV